MREFRAFRVCSDNNETIGRVESLNIDDLSQGEVLIKSAYSSVNYKDALAGTGVLKLTNNRFFLGRLVALQNELELKVWVFYSI